MFYFSLQCVVALPHFSFEPKLSAEVASRLRNYHGGVWLQVYRPRSSDWATGQGEEKKKMTMMNWVVRRLNVSQTKLTD